MLKKIPKIFYFLFCALGILYLALPGYDFPAPPPGSVQSTQPADQETPLRRGYYTNYSRAEVINWYKNQFEYSTFLGIRMPTLLFNYPPENAKTLIRDQTDSTFLQELAHPFRESWYINGYEPKIYLDRPPFEIDGVYYNQKIIIRQLPGNVWVREILFVVSMTMLAALYKGFTELFKKEK